MARVVPISGLAEKAPACFLIEAEGVRLLLDFGEGPPAGRFPDVAKIGRVDAVLLSHQHPDHMGALKLRSEIGAPEIFATKIVKSALTKDLAVKALPLNGEVRICGVRVRTGRSGHAPGGIWHHLAIGDGLLYMGDNCRDSILYANDPPPPAGTVIIDASYGDYDTPIGENALVLERLARSGPLLMPAVPLGRGPELAVFMARRGILPAIDDETRSAIQALTAQSSACVKPETLGILREIAERAPSASPQRPEGLAIVAPATANSGTAKTLVDQWSNDAAVKIVFTGYLQPGSVAQSLVKSGRAQLVRWNIHPLLSDNVALVRMVGAHTVLAAFGDRKFEESWRAAFAPARVEIDGAAEL